MGMSFALKLIMEGGKADQVETTSQVREATTVSSVLKLLFYHFQVGFSNLSASKSLVDT